MSSRSAAIVTTCFAIAANPCAYAQEAVELSAEELAARQRAEVSAVITQHEECDSDAMQADTIVVCRELEAGETGTQELMSVLPAPVETRRNQIDGLREPPCWITGKWPCGRVGWAPPPMLMVDLDAIPEALSDEDAALVFRAEDVPNETSEAETRQAGNQSQTASD